jgi:2-C-methyl-D-erythritol 4-phosphate cytidylyltransferase
MIVFPMAGASRRFSEAGFQLPKYMLEAHGRTLFAHAVMSFEAYFASEKFLFIYRDLTETPAFVEAECKRLGLNSVAGVTLDSGAGGDGRAGARPGKCCRRRANYNF